MVQIQDSKHFTSEIKQKAGERISQWNFFEKFPGAQPVSFDFDDIMKIQERKTIVCEKTDGMRYLLCEIAMGDQNLIFLIDRNYKFKQVWH